VNRLEKSLVVIVALAIALSLAQPADAGVSGKRFATFGFVLPVGVVLQSDTVFHANGDYQTLSGLTPAIGTWTQQEMGTLSFWQAEATIGGVVPADGFGFYCSTVLSYIVGVHTLEAPDDTYTVIIFGFESGPADPP
jgi:hypothetical protein